MTLINQDKHNIYICMTTNPFSFYILNSHFIQKLLKEQILDYDFAHKVKDDENYLKFCFFKINAGLGPFLCTDF